MASMASSPDLHLVAATDYGAVQDSAAVDDSVILLSDVTKRYEPTPRWMRPFVRSHISTPVQALDGVDLAVRAGEICAVVGPNGAGKTTLFRILVGLTTASTGCATVLGLDTERESEAVRQVTGWMPSEDRSLLMRATCKENLHLHGRLQGLSAKELGACIPEMLAVVGLERQHDSIVASLSAGRRARLRLARALLPEPSVLLLDEPTGAIDPIAAHALLGLITDLTRDRGLAVLLSSHRLEEIEALQSYALLLDRGRVRYSGELDRLRESLERPVVEIEFSGIAPALRVAATLVAMGIEVATEEAVVRFSVERRTDVGGLLAALERRDQREVRRIRELPMPLRDLIARMYSTEPVNECRVS
jgi:ABC-2 type transport system ATP-binding protein